MTMTLGKTAKNGHVGQDGHVKLRQMLKPRSHRPEDPCKSPDRRRGREDSPQKSGGRMILPHFDFELLVPKNVQRTNVCCFKPQALVLNGNSLGY